MKIMYIIQYRENSNEYYSGDKTRVDDRWCISPSLATRFKTLQEALLFKVELMTKLKRPGIYKIREIEVREPRELQW